MKLPKPNNIQVEKYVPGMSLFKKRLAKIKLSANESALGPSPRAIKAFAKDKNKTDDKRTMALINKPNYSLLQSSLKIDDLIDPRMTTVSSILKHIHKGTIENAYTISNGEYEVIEAEIIETSELINKEIKNSNLPDELRIGAILRDKKVIIPRSDFIFKKDDRVAFIVKKESISFVENIFRLSSV